MVKCLSAPNTFVKFTKKLVESGSNKVENTTEKDIETFVKLINFVDKSTKILPNVLRKLS